MTSCRSSSGCSRSKELADQKVLIFTEFADTARYLKRQLDKAGIDGVVQVDSATKDEPRRHHSALLALLQWHVDTGARRARAAKRSAS